MYLNYFESSKSARLFQIIDTLKNVHGVTIDVDRDSPAAEDLLNNYLAEHEEHRNRIMNESKFNSYQQNPEYIKCMLILEAVKIMLTEIAPKRKRRRVSESDSSIQEKETRMINPNLATQLKDISAKVPQSSSDFGPESAFANALSSMAQKISGESNDVLDDTEKNILSFLAKLPRPVKVSDFIKGGIEMFGSELASKRKDHIATLPKVDVSEQDRDGDGDEDFADVQIARMTASGMPKGKAIAMTRNKEYNKESAAGEDPIKKFKKKQVQGLHNYSHYEDPEGNWVQVSADKKKFVHHDKSSGKMTDFDDMNALKQHLTAKKAVTESEDMQPSTGAAVVPQLSQSSAKVLGQAHHYEYQASMARSELYRNAKYAMSMMKQVEPHGEIEPWIAGALTKAANILDKVYHYLDYYKKFEPEKLPENHDDTDLGETSGGVARQNLMMIMEYSTKLFEMIRPGDKLEGWVAMKLTTASECVSSCKHYMDYVQFENHAMADHFKEGRRASAKKIMENTDPLSKVAASMVSPRGIDRRDVSDDEWEVLKRVASGKYTGADRAKASKLITTFRRPDMKLPEGSESMLNEETDIARAATIIDAKNMANDLQDMAEEIAKASVEDLMPLVDIMRSQFGQEAADGFNSAVKPALDRLLDLTSKTKEEIEKAIDTLNKGGVPEKASDMEIDAEVDSDAQEPAEPVDDSDIAKDLDALEKSTEEEPEAEPAPPLGREKKELAESQYTATGRKHPDGKITVRIEGGTLKEPQVHTGSPTHVYKQLKDRYKLSSADVKMKDNVKEEVTEAASSDEEEKQTAIKNYKGPITVGPTRAARGSKYHRPGSGHVGRTPGVADADAPGMSRKVKEAKSAKEPGAVATAQVKKMGKKYWTGSNLTKDGIKKRDEIIRAIEKDQVSETVVNEYAPKGDEAKAWIADNEAKFLKQYGKKKGKQVLYATAWKMFGKKSDSYKDAKKLVKESNKMIDDLTRDLDRHRKEFHKLVLEGLQTDPLKVGHGLEGDRIVGKISLLQQKIAEANAHIREQMRAGVVEMMESIARSNKVAMIESMASTTPYGVIYQEPTGARTVKMFESLSTRDYWVKMHQDTVGTIKLINPENLDAISKKIAGA